MSHYIAVLAAGITSVALTWSIRQVCVRREWLASPVGDRLKHAPTPRFGGIAIVGAFALVCGVSGVWYDVRIAHLLLPAMGMFLLGLADDIWQISPRFKLLVQIALALVPVSFGITIPLSPWPLLNAFVTVFWFVGLTNAFNLLDNMNGLCAGTAIVVSIFRGLIALRQDDMVGFLLCITLAGATFGFLLFNFPKGLVFMGDSGALFLGFTLAGFAFTGTYAYLKSYLDLMVFPILLMLVPICDTTFVTVVRIMCGRPISQGGRDHLSHSLVASGLTAPRAVLVLWSISTACGAISLIATVYGTESAVMLVLILLGALVATTASLARYQVGIARAVDLFSSTSILGMALTVLSDVLVATGVLFAACMLGSSNENLGQWFFIRVGIPVIAAKVAAMALLRCYPRLTHMQFQRVVRLCIANTVGAILLLALSQGLLPDSGSSIALVDMIACPALIVGLRAYHRILERQCLAPLAVNEGSHD